ncbi:MAG: hypothetical protein WCG78_06805 [Candidatus Omnitrophota bacterium]
MLQKIAMIAAVVLPFWNIPLIARIIKRRSSKDISLYWAIGVWVCLMLVAPSGFVSPDPVWKVYNIVNFVLFTLVVIFVLAYRKK